MVFTVDIPTDQEQNVIDAFCLDGYQSTVTGPDGASIPNPESTAEYANRRVSIFVIEKVRGYLVNQQIIAAAETAQAKVDVTLPIPN